MHIALEIGELLKQRDVSLYEFCKVADISYQQGLNIAKQKTKSISFEMLEKLCLYLNCSISDVLIMESETEGYLQHILTGFPETDNVTRLPQTKPDSAPKPFLQWIGGKREMIKQYQPFLPTAYSKYWEPFLGGGALYFHLNPQNAIINDNNPELIRTYEAIRDYPSKVIDLLQQFKRKHSKELFMVVRSIDRQLDILADLKPYEIAARLLYLNQTCFNGVYRVNKNGQFNVPIGSSLNRVICDPEAIKNASRTLKNAKITCADFDSLLDEASKGDFIYLDPPYYPVSEYSDFTRYTKEQFHKNDQLRLYDLFARLDAKGCYVMLSNSNAEFIKELYSSYNIIFVDSGRNLNSKKDKRGKVKELLVTNYRNTS